MFYIGHEHPFQTNQSVALSSEASRIRSQLDVTGEMADGVQYELDRHQTFRKAKPMSEADAAHGQICTRSKFWFPARMVVYVGGLPYGAPYAPKNEPRPLTD